MKNIVLIGMPGSGKSTVGKQVARTLDYRFFDTDMMIEQAAGIPISIIFEEFGESHFRDLETAAARHAAIQTRAVISCGGGMILREENVMALRKNGLLFYLCRPLAQLLQTDLFDRPLVQNDEQRLTALYEQRAPLYEASAAFTIFNDKSAQHAADEIVAAYRSEEDESLEPIDS